MTRKILNKSAPGSGTKFGADDTDYINKYLTGVDQSATDPVDINTTTKYRSSKLQVANPANTFKYTVAADTILADKTLNLSNLEPLPDQERIGGWNGGGWNDGFGFIRDSNDGGVPRSIIASSSAGATNINDTSGKYLNFGLGTVSGNQSGQRCAHAMSYLQRRMQPWLKVKFRLNTSASNTRFFCGLINDAAAFATGDDPLNAKTGIALFLRAADTTNWQIARNDASGATTITSSGIARDTNIHTFEIRAPPADDSYEWRMDGGSWTNYTTDIPQSTNDVVFQIVFQNADTGAGKTMDVWWWYIRLPL